VSPTKKSYLTSPNKATLEVVKDEQLSLGGESIEARPNTVLAAPEPFSNKIKPFLGDSPESDNMYLRRSVPTSPLKTPANGSKAFSKTSNGGFQLKPMERKFDPRSTVTDSTKMST
jgi:hypothetical protein